MNKVTAEEILFKYHTHADMVFPEIEELQGDLTTIYTHESALAAMKEFLEAYKQSSVSDDNLVASPKQSSEPVVSLTSTSGNSIEEFLQQYEPSKKLLREIAEGVMADMSQLGIEVEWEQMEDYAKNYSSSLVDSVIDAMLNDVMNDERIATQQTMPEEPEAGIQNHPPAQNKGNQ
jgi:predicted RNase H-like HicB family nuclease